jgi:hypothetical protein
VSRTRCLQALVNDREPIVTEREPEALSIVSEREPKMAAVCEPNRLCSRATTPERFRLFPVLPMDMAHIEECGAESEPLTGKQILADIRLAMARDDELGDAVIHPDELARGIAAKTLYCHVAA